MSLTWDKNNILTAIAETDVSAPLDELAREVTEQIIFQSGAPDTAANRHLAMTSAFIALSKVCLSYADDHAAQAQENGANWTLVGSALGFVETNTISVGE